MASLEARTPTGRGAITRMRAGVASLACRASCVIPPADDPTLVDRVAG
jgi:hypothetical protein